MKEGYSGKRAKSRTAILHAAKGLFESKGIHNVTFQEIADRAGMSRTTVFNYFSTINDLLIALADEEVDDLLAYCDASGLAGEELVQSLFLRLIDDTANYPLLTIRLIFNGILNGEKDGSITRLEQKVIDNADGETYEEKENRLLLLSGLYYGLVNHYLIGHRELDAVALKEHYLALSAQFA